MVLGCSLWSLVLVALKWVQAIIWKTVQKSLNKIKTGKIICF